MKLTTLGKKQFGSLGARTGLHVNELWLRPCRRQEREINIIRSAVKQGVTFFAT